MFSVQLDMIRCVIKVVPCKFQYKLLQCSRGKKNITHIILFGYVFTNTGRLVHIRLDQGIKNVQCILEKEMSKINWFET